MCESMCVRLSETRLEVCIYVSMLQAYKGCGGLYVAFGFRGHIIFHCS